MKKNLILKPVELVVDYKCRFNMKQFMDIYDNLKVAPEIFQNPLIHEIVNFGSMLPMYPMTVAAAFEPYNNYYTIYKNRLNEKIGCIIYLFFPYFHQIKIYKI